MDDNNELNLTTEEQVGNLGLTDHLAHQQWLLSHGFINDLHKDNLFAFGSLIHSDVRAVHVKIAHEKKTVNYDIYVDRSLIKSLAKYKKLVNTTSIFGLWKLKRLIKKEGNLNFNFIIDKFTKDYCGKDWKAKLKVVDIAEYKDDLSDEKEKEQQALPANAGNNKLDI